MKTLIVALALSASAYAQTFPLQYSANYRQINVANEQALKVDAATANILLQAESITLKDGTIINISRNPRDLTAPRDISRDIRRDITQDVTVIIRFEGSGTGGGG